MADYYRQKKIYDALRASETPENPFDERQKKLLDTIGISLGEEEKRQDEFVSGALRNVPAAVAPGLSTIGPLMVKARREYPSIVRPIEQAAMGYLDTAALGAFSTAAKLADPESEVETAPRNIPEHLAKGLGQLGGFIQGAPLRIGKAATTQILKSAAGKGLANKAVKFGEALAGKIIGKTAAGKALGQTGLAEASRTAVKEALTLGVASAVSANESLADYLRTPSYDTAAKIASEKGFSAAFGTLTGGQFGVVMGAFDKFATRAAINLALTNAMRIGLSGGEINTPDIIFGSLLDIFGSIGGKKPTKQELATLSQAAKDVEPAVTEALNKIHTELPETAPKAGKQAELPLQGELFSATKPAEPGFQKRGEVFPKDPALAKVEQLEQKPNLTPPEVDAALVERTLELEQAGKTLEGDPILTRLDNLSRRLYSQKPPEKPERPGQQTLDLSTKPTQAELPLETFTRRGDVEKPQTFESRGDALQPETLSAEPAVTPVPKPITDFKVGDKINITPFGELIITKVGENQLKAKREGSDTEIIVSKDTVQKSSQPEPAQTAPPISEPAQVTPPVTGSQNTIFTQSAYETALASLKQNAGKLYDIGGALGDTPEAIKNWVVIGGYHLERGVRNFNAWSKHMLDELGEQIRPYLRSIWDAANKGLTDKSLDFSNLDPQPFFYSQMREVLRRKLPESGTPESMLQVLEGMQKSGEFSRDEFEWSQISDFLKSAKEQKIKVKKQDILELADSNNIRVEVNTRENKDQVQLRRSLEEAYRKRTGREPLDADNFGTEDFEASPEGERWIETWRDERGARFSKYTLDGGKSGENYAELTFNVPDVEYRSPHFEDIGTIAHARTTDRSNIAGQKVKLIEEIQSELHQQGRKKGYEYVSPDRLNTLRAKISDNQKERSRLEALYRIEEITLPQKNQLKQLENEFSSLTAELFELTSIAPPAPLKSDWPTTVFKWLLRDAVDKGQDKIAWTPAEEQFNRYGSERIEWQKQKSGAWIIEAYGIVFPKTSVFKPSAAMLNPVFSDPRLETLSAYHTYDPTIRTKGDLYKIIKRILPEPDKQRNQELTDRIWEQMQAQDSGVVMPRKEGMEQFYDKALPSAVNKYIKKWGGKVETDQIPTSQGNAPVHAVTITPEMKQAVRTGQPISGTQTTLVPEASYRSALETIRTASIFTQSAYETAIASLKQNAGKLYDIGGALGDTPETIKNWVIIGGYHFEKGLRDFNSWSATLLREYGDAIKPHLRAIWNTIQRINSNIELSVSQRFLDALEKGAVAETGRGIETVSTNKKELLGTKVVDEKGKPRVVYHGTKAIFEEFDPRFQDSGAMYGKGFYFTESPKIASGYTSTKDAPPEAKQTAPNVKMAYLRIKKPFDLDKMYDVSELSEETQALFKSVGIKEKELSGYRIYNLYDMYSSSPYAAIKTAEGMVYVGRSSSHTDLAKSFDISDSELAQATKGWSYGDEFMTELPQRTSTFRDFLKQNEFDGITHVGGKITGSEPHQVWIAFDANQIVYPDEFVKAQIKTQSFEQELNQTNKQLSNTFTPLFTQQDYKSALQTLRTASIEAAKGVYELAGGSRLGAKAGGFTRQDYEQAAPHFRKAWETVGAYHAERLSKSDNLRYQPWTQAMVKDLGEGIRPRLEHIWQSVQDDFAANIKVGRYPAGTQDILRQMTSDATTPMQSEKVRRGVLTRERRQNLARLEGDYIERVRKGIELKHKDRRATPEQLEALNAEVARRAIEFQKDPNLLRETLRDPEKSKEIHNLILTQQRETADAGRKLEMLKGAVDPGVAEGFAMLFKYSENPELKEAAKEMAKSFEKGAPPKASFMHYWTELQRNFLLALSSATKSVVSTALAIAYRFPVRTLASWIEIAAHKDPKQREIFWQGVIGEATQGYLKRENWKKGAVDFMKVIKEDDVALRESSMLQTETQGVRAFKRFGRTIRFEQNLQGGIDAFGRNILTPGIIADKIVTLARREGLTPSKDPVSDYVKRIDALQRDVQAVLDIQNNGHVAAREAGFTIGSREYDQAYNAFVKQELAKVPNADQVVDIIKRSRKEAAEELGLGDLTGVAGAVQKFRQQHLWTKLIVPFFPSFANFMKKAVAHTPFAAVMPSFYKAAYRALHTKGELPESSWGRFQEFMFGKTIKEMKAEDRTTAEFSERLSRMVFGSAVISTGFSLIVDMIDGKISGRGPDDPRIKDMMNKANGWKPYSVKIGDEWISYLGYEPLSTWMALMADWQYEDNQDLSSLDKIAKSFKTLATTSLENPFMLGIKGMIDAAEQDRKTSTYVSNFIGSFTMPTVARQFRYVLDPTYRVTKEKEILTGAWEKYQARVPGLSEQFLPRIDVFGNPVEKEYPLLSMIGINVSDAKYSKAAQEMVRLKINIGEPGDMIKGVNLSPREHQMLKIITGRALKEGLEKLIQTPGYKNLPDDRKREHIEASIRAIRNQARGELQRQLRFYPR